MAYDGTLKFDTKIETGGFQSGMGKIGDVAVKGLSIAAKAIAAAGTAILALGGYAVKVGSDFEAAISQVEAISGATGDELQALSDKAKEMGATTKFSATESANALNYMAMAGWDAEQMLGGLEGIMNLAAASGSDLALVSDIVTDALTAFGLQAEDSSHFADVLAAASANANTNVEMMGATFQYVAPVAGALGYSIEDTAVAIGLMANAGIKGERAGTALRSLMTRLTTGTGEAQKAIDSLGVSLTNEIGEMLPLADVLEQLRVGFSDMTEEEKASTAAALAGQEGMSGLLAIVNAAPADFDKLTEAIAGADGEALRMAETMQDNLQGSLTIAKSAAEGFGIAFYETFSDSLKGVVDTATGWIGDLTAAMQEGGAPAVIDMAGNIISQMVAGLAENAPMLVESAVGLIDAVLLGLQENAPLIAEGALGIVQSLIEGLLLMLPTLAEIGIQLLASLVTGIGEMLPTLIPLAVETIITLVTGLTQNIGLLVNAAISLMTGLVNGLITALPILIDAIPSIITGLVDAVVANAPLLLTAGVQLIGQLAVGLIQAIPQLVEKLPEIVTSIVDGIEALLGSVIEVGGDIVRGLWQGIKDAGAWLAEQISGFFGGVVDSIKDFFGIASPSKLLADEVGKWIPPGIQLGFDLAMPKLNQDAIKQMQGFVGTIDDALAQSMLKMQPVLHADLTRQAGAYAISSGATEQFPAYSSGKDDISSQPIAGDTINIYGDVQDPDVISREMKKIKTFGLAGERA